MKKIVFLTMITILLIIAGCSGGGEKTEITVRLSDAGYLHMKYPVWFGENEGLDKEGLNEDIKLGIVEEMLTDKEEAVAILGKRIEGAAEPVTGLAGMFNKQQLTVVALDEPDTWMFTINRKVNSERLTRLLQAKVDLGFWETYELKEIWDNLAQANFLLGNTSAGSELMIEPDTTEYGVKNPLFRFLRPNINNEGEMMSGSIVGYAKISDTAIINSLFALTDVNMLLPRNLKLVWSSKPDQWMEDFITLIALKESSIDRKPLLTNDYIVEASLDGERYPPAISMTMNSEGAALWKRITSDNIDREIAVTLNGSVLFHPRVMQAIESGSTSISAGLTEEEAADMAILLGSGSMPPFGVEVVEIKEK